MNCFDELLKYMPDLADKPAMIVGYLVKPVSGYDQVIYIDGRLIDARGKPIGNREMGNMYANTDPRYVSENNAYLKPSDTVKEQAHGG